MRVEIGRFTSLIFIFYLKRETNDTDLGVTWSVL